MCILTLTGFLATLSLGYDAEFLRVAKAIMQIESGGDPQAVGDHGKAIGPYQIHRRYWIDATGFMGQDWPYWQAKDPAKALAAMYAYTKHYARRYHRPWNAETIARIHNGGPNGWKRAATWNYWTKTEKTMKGIER